MRVRLLIVVLFAAALGAGSSPARADPWLPLSRDELPRHLVVGISEYDQRVTFGVLSHQPMSDNDLITPWIATNANRLPPAFLAELARRLFAENPELAWDWYAVALTRARYDEGRCIERTTGPTEAVGNAIRGPDGIGPLIADPTAGPDALADAYARVLHRPDLMSDDVAFEWSCWSSNAEDVQRHPLPADALRPKAPPGLRPRSEWPQIRQAVLEDTAARASGKPLGGPPHPGRVIKHLASDATIGVAWSPDGKVIATAGESAIELWDAETAQRLRELTPAAGADVLEPPSFTADGQYLFVAEGNRVPSDAAAVITVWDVQTGKHAGVFDALRGSGLFALDAQHHRLALDMTGPDEDGVIFLYPSVGRTRRLGTLTMGGYDPPRALAFAPDGKVLVVAFRREILLFDLETEAVLRRIHAYDADELPAALAYNPNGSYLAVGSVVLGAARRSLVRIWKAQDGGLLRALPGDDLEGLGWAPDGRYVTRTERSGSLRFWNVVSGASTEVATRWEGTGPLAFSPDGKKIVAKAEGGGADIIEAPP
jgi:hypothetical protein